MVAVNVSPGRRRAHRTPSAEKATGASDRATRTVTTLSAGSTSGRVASVCGHTTVATNAGAAGSRIGPPAESE